MVARVCAGGNLVHRQKMPSSFETSGSARVFNGLSLALLLLNLGFLCLISSRLEVGGGIAIPQAASLGPGAPRIGPAKAFFATGNQRLCNNNASWQFARVKLATVPRSGGQLGRTVLESSTGVATEVEVKESPDDVYSDLSNAWAAPCGILKNCTEVKRSDGAEPVIVKTSFPYMVPDPPKDECVSAVITTIRHPLDNYFAYLRYRVDQMEQLPTDGPNRLPLRVFPSREAVNNGTLETFKKFADKWAGHHNYWRTYARQRGIPLLQIRFEDMCGNPEGMGRALASFVANTTIPAVKMVSGVPPTDCVLKNLKDATWKALLSRVEVERVLAEHVELLDWFGYPRSWDAIDSAVYSRSG